MTREEIMKIVADARAEGRQPDLHGNDLRNADLSRADMTGADTTGANLRGARELEETE